MKNRKKYIVLFLIAASVLLLLTGCNKGKYGDDTKAKSEEVTRSLVQTLADGHYSAAVEELPYTSKAKNEIDAGYLEAVWTAAADGKGHFIKIDALQNENWDKNLSITAECHFEKGTAELVVSFDRTVKIKAVEAY